MLPTLAIIGNSSSVIARQFPDFVLEVENDLEEGRVSHTANLGIINSNFDSIDHLKEEEEGSTGRRIEPTGKDIKRVASLQMGPRRINGTLTVEALIKELSQCEEGPSVSVLETSEMDTGQQNPVEDSLRQLS
jgi:hypothetical protein